MAFFRPLSISHSAPFFSRLYFFILKCYAKDTGRNCIRENRRSVLPAKEGRKGKDFMAGIKDVARRAGVGVGTVSRALNGSGYISEETRKKILEAAKALDYQPNELAKNLYRNKTDFIGIMMPNLEHPFFASLLKHLELELYRYGYKCMVCSTEDIDNREREFLDMLKRNVMDGIIACVDLPGDEEPETERPVVTLERNWGGGIPMVHSDHAMGGKIAAQVMLEAGCRKVLHLYSQGKDSPFEQRHRVFREIMSAHGVQLVEAEAEWNHMSYGYDLEMARRCVRQYSDVDGIFASDVQAFGCMAAALEMGKRVPEDLQIVGYDGTEITRMTYPTLTCICQDLPRLAKVSVQTMVALLEGKPYPEDLVIPVSLQKGGTVRWT